MLTISTKLQLALNTIESIAWNEGKSISEVAGMGSDIIIKAILTKNKYILNQVIERGDYLWTNYLNEGRN